MTRCAVWSTVTHGTPARDKSTYATRISPDTSYIPIPLVHNTQKQVRQAYSQTLPCDELQGLSSARISIKRSTSASSVRFGSAAIRSRTCRTRDLPYIIFTAQ